jgi:hypothetical protein
MTHGSAKTPVFLAREEQLSDKAYRMASFLLNMLTVHDCMDVGTIETREEGER